MPEDGQYDRYMQHVLTKLITLWVNDQLDAHLRYIKRLLL